MTGIKEVELSAGKVRYRDSGSGDPIVFVHGLLVDGTLWRNVVAPLEERFRCIAPDWPKGSHRVPMKPGADLSPGGITRLVAEFLERMELENVTLVANDSGGVIAQQLAVHYPERIGRLVLTPCDVFENFPPPRFRYLRYLARIPGTLALGLHLARIPRIQRLPIAFGGVAKHPISPQVIDAWLRPARTNSAIRLDTKRFMKTIDRRYTLDVVHGLHSFTQPVLLAWPAEDRAFPFEHARQLARIFPNAILKQVRDSYSFVPEDQPGQLAALIADFAGQSVDAGAPTPTEALT